MGAMFHSVINSFTISSLSLVSSLKHWLIISENVSSSFDFLRAATRIQNGPHNRELPCNRVLFQVTFLAELGSTFRTSLAFVPRLSATS